MQMHRRPMNAFFLLDFPLKIYEHERDVILHAFPIKVARSMSPSLESTSGQALATIRIILSAYNLPRLVLFGLIYVIDEMSTANLYARLRDSHRRIVTCSGRLLNRLIVVAD